MFCALFLLRVVYISVNPYSTQMVDNLPWLFTLTRLQTLVMPPSKVLTACKELESFFPAARQGKPKKKNP
jgi:hypothetical protein